MSLPWPRWVSGGKVSSATGTHSPSLCPGPWCRYTAQRQALHSAISALHSATSTLHSASSPWCTARFRTRSAPVAPTTRLSLVPCRVRVLDPAPYLTWADSNGVGARLLVGTVIPDNCPVEQLQVGSTQGPSRCVRTDICGQAPPYCRQALPHAQLKRVSFGRDAFAGDTRCRRFCGPRWTL